MNAIPRPQREPVDVPMVTFTMDGREMTAPATDTLIEIADREGIDIPRLCYKAGMEAVGNCRSCMVEIKGERVLAASCCRVPTKGMQVTTDSERVHKSQKMVIELLQSDMPEREYTRHNEVDEWAARLDVGKPRFAPRPQVAPDLSHAAIAVNLDACIQCTRCVRACRDEQMNDVIGLASRGQHAKIVFDMDDPMGGSTCVALRRVRAGLSDRRADAGPRRGTDGSGQVGGFALSVLRRRLPAHVHVKNDSILYVEGRDGPANHARLCVKGRYGFDYSRHPQRLTKPLIRRTGRRPRAAISYGSQELSCRCSARPPGRRRSIWRPGLLRKFATPTASGRSPDSARPRAATKRRTCSRSWCARLRRNNVDHCTRLCHASSVAALLEGIGSGAVSNPVMDVNKASVVILIGANPTVNHPVAATFLKNAMRNGSEAHRDGSAPQRACAHAPINSYSSSPIPMWRFSMR